MEDNDIFEETEEKDNKKIFKRFEAKDIVYLAIISSIMLVTSSVMPIVAHVPIFGIIQIVLGLQFSLFPAMGISKIRKPGSLIFMSLFSGVVLVFMNPIMFFCLLLCAFIAELISFLIFRGYYKNASCFLASWLYLPLTLPFLYLWYQIIGADNSVASYANGNPILAIIMSYCVIVLCALGSFLGMKISLELEHKSRKKHDSK